MEWYVKTKLKCLMQDKDTRIGAFEHIRPYIYTLTFHKGQSSSQA